MGGGVGARDHADQRGQGCTFIKVARGAVPRRHLLNSALSRCPLGAALAASDAGRVRRPHAADARHQSRHHRLCRRHRDRLPARHASGRARREAAAELEAERYRLSESTLETLLAAEPQALLIVAEGGEAELLVANLPAALGVPRDAAALLNFADWLDAASAPDARRRHRRAGRAGRAVQSDAAHAPRPLCRGRRPHRRRAPSCSRCATSPASGSILPMLAARHRQLEEQVASLRGCSTRRIRPSAAAPSPSRASRRASGASTGSPPPSPCSTPSQRLTHFNQAYVELWQLDAGMARHPSARRRDPRPAAPGAAAAGEGRLSRLEEGLARPSTAPMRRSRTYGTCPTAARCMSSPTARARRA